jgi:DNA invertase Pin-like site-specific DNA recombinase
MNKITADHLSRAAYVYVRQSTPHQLINNRESRRRQYGLRDRARALGWENVILVDDDLGRTASGTERPGFESLLTAVCIGVAGAVFSIEDSRLARNGREWQTLLELCGLVNCLIIDENTVYDPRIANDRLLLGIKGVFSELELSVIRQRSQEALRLKAARGELYTRVAIGYVRGIDDRLEMDLNKQICEALRFVFRKFVEFGSVRQVVLWLTDEEIKMPLVVGSGQQRGVEWRRPGYDTIYRMLTNPVYAGAYVFGRTESKIGIKNGRKQIAYHIRRPQEEWGVLIHDRHEGYISWEDYERNQRIIHGNANMKGSLVQGSVRNGAGLLVGLLRCGPIKGHTRAICATTALTGGDLSAFLLGTCASMRRFRKRCCARSRRSALRRPYKRLRIVSPHARSVSGK